MNTKVTVISNMYPTNEHKSFGIFVKNQVEALRNKGLAVDVIAIDNPNKGKLNLLKKYGRWILSFAVHLLLKGRRTQVVHAHYVFPSGLLARWYKKLFGARFIVTAHGGDIDKMAQKSKRIFTATKNILKEADHVIAVGQELYETLQRDYDVSQEKLALINMGVNLEIFKARSKQEARDKCAIPKGKIPLLFVGNIIRQKGLDELVAAFAGLKQQSNEIELYVIGSNKDTSYYQELTDTIMKKNVAEGIHFLGTKNQEEVALWMAAAEAFILPSHIEGFGLVALEAMACGTPVIGTNVGGLKYLLSEGNGVLVEARNEESLTKGIQSVLASEELKHKLIDNGLNKARENDQEIMTERVLDLYLSRQSARA